LDALDPTFDAFELLRVEGLDAHPKVDVVRTKGVEMVPNRGSLEASRREGISKVSDDLTLGREQ
jgi:hypothetical protein